ncbi:MAG: 2OG-Fe(II) oxygenase [Deltaproteobacteria bacterium]|nr:2OG-Fe(II) oxygenase [Deltaproteobacteria bacterium]
MTNFAALNVVDTSFLNRIDIQNYKNEWAESKPFNHIVIDNFLSNRTIEAVVNEFPNFDSGFWRIYNNAIEVKKLLNHWDKFGAETYKLFNYLNSREFISKLEILTGCDLYADFGLNGGGLHTHKRGGKLNAHLDYSIHPKLKLERRLNLLIYVTPDWKDNWGGFLGLWEKHNQKNAPGKLIKNIAPTFNRAVIFDTTQNSWHGLPEPINCPESITRNSVAVYYLCNPRQNANDRGKALFAPTKEQENDLEVLSLIEKRSQVNSAAEVYGDKK